MTRAKDISKILTDADISGNLDVDGVTNLDVVDIDGAVDMASTLNVSGAITGDLTGNADTATTLATARTIGGTSFNGSANIAVGLADTATVLATARTINGTSFNGSANITISAGKVLQVIHASTTAEVGSTSATFADTGLTAAITPSATSSKILIIYSVSQFMTVAGASGHLKVVRGSTDLATHGYGNYAGSSTVMSTSSYQHLDSPSTTSATTYKIQFNRINGGSVICQYDDASGEGVSTIILMEIAG